MNGRVYDPATAMFFSPDPFVQSPGDWSNYNRYSYVSNNPTRFTDPSGYIKGYFDTPVMDPGWTRISSTYFGGSGSGRNAAFAAWDAQHMGSISYDWGNNRYEYANGNEASTSSALNQLYDRTRPEDKQYYAGSTLGYDHLYTITLGGQLRLAGSIGGEITGISNGFFVNSNANTLSWVLAANGEATAWGENSKSQGNSNPFLNIFEYSGDYGEAIGNRTNAILVNRGAYMPRGQIFSTNIPITVRTPIGLINTSSKTLKYVKTGGKFVAGVGLAATVIDAGIDIFDGKYKSGSAKLIVTGLAAGAVFIPVVGWGISLSIATADFIWGDNFYDWLEQ